MGVLWRRPRWYSAMRYIALLPRWFRELYCPNTYVVNLEADCWIKSCTWQKTTCFDNYCNPVLNSSYKKVQWRLPPIFKNFFLIPRRINTFWYREWAMGWKIWGSNPGKGKRSFSFKIVQSGSGPWHRTCIYSRGQEGRRLYTYYPYRSSWSGQRKLYL